MSLDWQELPDGFLNLITQKTYTLAEARDLINRHLLARGYTMLIQGEVISVFKVDSINPGMVPRVAPDGGHVLVGMGRDGGSAKAKDSGLRSVLRTGSQAPLGPDRSPDDRGDLRRKGDRLSAARAFGSLWKSLV